MVGNSFSKAHITTLIKTKFLQYVAFFFKCAVLLFIFMYVEYIMPIPELCCLLASVVSTLSNILSGKTGYFTNIKIKSFEFYTVFLVAILGNPHLEKKK